MLQKIIYNDQQWERAKEEVTQVVAQHNVTQTKLEKQEHLTFMGQQRARVSDNMHVLCILRGSQCVRVVILYSTERDGKAEEGPDWSDDSPGSTKGSTKFYIF